MKSVYLINQNRYANNLKVVVSKYAPPVVVSILKKIKKSLVSRYPKKNDILDERRRAGDRYLRGEGIEIGALHNPLSVNTEKVRVKYIDRMSRDDLLKHYPNFQKDQLVVVDGIDNGELLATIKDNSLDFIIANHFLEHCMDPIKTIKNHLSKLKIGGILFYAVPDKRFTFDKDRDCTTFDHILNDFHHPSPQDDYQHYIEWTTLVNKVEGEQQIYEATQNLYSNGYSIHYHVWDYNTFHDFIVQLKKYLKDSFTIKLNQFNSAETICILMKTRN